MLNLMQWLLASRDMPMGLSESGIQTTVSETQLSGGGIQPPGSGSKSRKHKRGRNEVTNALLEKMITMQKSSDQMMMSLEEKQMRMEERQMELDAQIRREEGQFQLHMMHSKIWFTLYHHQYHITLSIPLLTLEA